MSPPTAPRDLGDEIVTDAMLKAARDWSAKKYGKPIGNDAARGCFEAMNAARPQPAGVSEGDVARVERTIRHLRIIADRGVEIDRLDFRNDKGEWVAASVAIENAIALLPSPTAPVVTWQGIESAPRDGRWFEARALWDCGFEEKRTCRFDRPDDRLPIGGGAWSRFPTQWRPAPPSKPSPEGEEPRSGALEQAIRKAALIARDACLVPPDGGSPSEEERLVCEEAERRILAMLPRSEDGAGEVS